MTRFRFDPWKLAAAGYLLACWFLAAFVLRSCA